MSAKTSHRRAAGYAPQVQTDFLEVTEWALTDDTGRVSVVQTLNHAAPTLVHVKGEVRKVIKARLVTAE